MPKDSADDILELTDIVEKGTLPSDNAKATPDVAGGSSFEDELDALFGDVDSDLAQGEEEADKAIVDADEKLNMPDMSDLDSLLDDLGDEADIDKQTFNDDANKHIDGVDELLAEILPDAPTAVEDLMAETLAAPAAPLPPTDDFDDLLATMEAGDTTPNPGVKAPSAPEAEPVSANPADPADIDAIFAEFETKPEEESAAAAKPVPGEEPAPAPDSEPDSELAQLDALIDDIMAPGSGETAGTAMPEAVNPSPTPQNAASEPELPAEEPVAENNEAAAMAGPATDQAHSEVAAASAAEMPPSAAPGHFDLEALAKQLAEGPLLAGIHAMVVEEVKGQLAESAKNNSELEARFADLEDRLSARLNESVDKAAAAAAAKIIREEIAVMLQEL